MWTTIWITWGVLSVIALAAPEAKSLPVVPNFQQGTLKSTTTTKQKVNEVINSYQYRTGYEYTVSGTNIEPVSGNLAPAGLTVETNNLNGVSSRWVGLDLQDKPTWQIVKPGASFQFIETVSGPGLTQHTIIQRETDIESVTETLSTFTQ
jgi:PP-loop superfamily ATP-utilizing enzyme